MRYWISVASTDQLKGSVLRGFIAALAAMLFALALLPVAHATGTLSFSGGGYWIDLEIGHDGNEQIAKLRFHAANDPKGVVLPIDHRLRVQRFDTRQRVLKLSYIGTNVAPFTLSAKGNQAMLEIEGRKIVSGFSWEM